MSNHFGCTYERNYNKRLSGLLQFNLALIVYEGSMVDLKVMGALETWVALTALECCHAQELWGAMPVVLLLGDCYQLPSIRDGEKIISLKKYQIVK